MPTSGLGTSGIVAIPIPAGGAPGFVLTKVTGDDYDFDWLAGGGGASTLQDAYDNATAVPQITVAAGDPLTIDIPAASNNIFQLRDETNATLLRVGTVDDALLELTSTTQAFRIMTMTTAQKNALTNTEGFLVYDSDLNQLQQNDGVVWTTPGAGLTTLQGAYDNSLGAVPQILLDGVPTPISIRASVAGSVLEIQDVGAANVIFEVDADPDLIVARAGITVEDPFLNAAAPNSIVFSETYTQTGAFIGGPILSNGTITTGVSTTWIWALLQESKAYLIGINPAFAAFTLFNALASIGNSGNFNLVQAIITNNGVSHRRTSAGTSTTAQNIGLNNAPNTRGLVAGAVMTKTTGDIGLNFAPTFGTVAGSTVNFGTARAVWARNIAAALFQPGAGIENLTGYIVVEVDALPFGGNVTKRALRSGLTAATNTLMIENTGGANSDFGAGGVHFDDNAPVQFGGTAFNAQDASIFWAPAGFLEFFFAANGDSFELSNAVNNQIVMAGDTTSSELALDFTRGLTVGAPSTLGNQFCNFAQPALTVPVGGDWAGILLTQAGNLSIGALAMGRVSAWVINGTSLAAGTGSIGNTDTLTVGGMVTSSPGITVTERQSLHVIAGRSRFQSVMQYDPITPATLAAGTTQDYAGLLTGTANNGMRHWARLAGDGAGTSALGGIDATFAQDGDTFKLTNVSANNVTLNDQDAGSVAANRIISPTGANYVLGPDESAEIVYDLTTARWRILYGTGA